MRIFLNVTVPGVELVEPAVVFEGLIPKPAPKETAKITIQQIMAKTPTNPLLIIVQLKKIITVKF